MLPKDLRDARELTKKHLEGLLNKHLWLTKIEAKALVEHPETPLLEVLIASIVDKAVNHGDEKRLDFILNRLIGKVSEQIDINSYMGNLQKMSETQIIDLGKDAIKFLGDKKDE